MSNFDCKPLMPLLTRREVLVAGALTAAGAGLEFASLTRVARGASSQTRDRSLPVQFCVWSEAMHQRALDRISRSPDSPCRLVRGDGRAADYLALPEAHPNINKGYWWSNKWTDNADLLASRSQAFWTVSSRNHALGEARHDQEASGDIPPDGSVLYREVSALSDGASPGSSLDIDWKRDCRVHPVDGPDLSFALPDYVESESAAIVNIFTGKVTLREWPVNACSAFLVHEILRQASGIDVSGMDTEYRDGLEESSEKSELSGDDVVLHVVYDDVIYLNGKVGYDRYRRSEYRDEDGTVHPIYYVGFWASREDDLVAL